MQVTFVLDDGEIERLRRLDPDRHWRELLRGERAWVLQTFLHLARAGYPARLVSQLPPSGLVVFHAKQRHTLLGRRRGVRGPVLLAIRGDIGAPRIADFEVVQNRRSADGERRFFIPHWPQPGLLPRDPARGTTVSRVAYKGFDANLDPYYRSSEWEATLRARGIEWVTDSVPFAERRTRAETLAWPDFRAVDLLLAVRPGHLPRRAGKPATKLYNAWHAGVPALLGPDAAFRELRRSPLDYLEVGSPAEARDAVSRLAADPELYGRMVENGRRRAAEFTASAIARRWLELFEEILPARLGARAGPSRRPRLLPRPLKMPAWVRRTRQVLCLD